MPYRPTLQQLEAEAARRGLRLEKLVLARGNVRRYALFPNRSLRDALLARFYPTLTAVADALAD